MTLEMALERGPDVGNFGNFGTGFKESGLTPTSLASVLETSGKRGIGRRIWTSLRRAKMVN
jgi:hypothetical protein